MDRLVQRQRDGSTDLGLSRGGLVAEGYPLWITAATLTDESRGSYLPKRTRRRIAHAPPPTTLGTAEARFLFSERQAKLPSMNERPRSFSRVVGPRKRRK